jgi:hypothetical protein
MAEATDVLQHFSFSSNTNRPSSNTIPKTLRELSFPPICNSNNSPDTTTIHSRNHASPPLVITSTSPIMGPLNPNRASKSITIVPQPRRSLSSPTTTITTPPPTAINAEETMSGWLLKRSKNLQKSWKRNWFVLRESPSSNNDDNGRGGSAQLVYYKDEREYKPKNIINTAEILAVVAMEPKHFAIFTDRKDYHLRAETVAECAQWVARLKRIVERNNIGLAPLPPPTTTTTTATTTTTTNTNTTAGAYGLSQSVPTATAATATPAIPIAGSGGAGPSSSYFSSYAGSSPGGSSSLFAHSISSLSRGAGGATAAAGAAAAVSPESYPGSDYFLSPDEDPEHLLSSPAAGNYAFSPPPTAPGMMMASASSPTSGSGISAGSSPPPPPKAITSTTKKKRHSMLGLPRPSFSMSHHHDPAVAKSEEETATATMVNQALELGLVEGYSKKTHYKHWRQQLLVLTHTGLYVYSMKHAVDSTATATTAAAAGDARLLHAIPLDCLVDASEAAAAISKRTGKAYLFELIAAIPPTTTTTNITSTAAEPRLRRMRFAVPTENELVRWLAALKLAIDQQASSLLPKPQPGL